MSKMSNLEARMNDGYRPAKIAALCWDRDDDGWSASSGCHDEGVPLKYKITVEDDGRFSVNESESELYSSHVPTFPTISQAMDFCEAVEHEWNQK